MHFSCVCMCFFDDEDIEYHHAMSRFILPVRGLGFEALLFVSIEIMVNYLMRRHN